MRTIKRKNRFIKRIALGLAIAAFAAPVAHAKSGDQPWPAGNPYDLTVTSVKASDYHAVRPSPHDPALARGNGGSVNTQKPHGLGGALARGDTQASPSVVASVLGAQPSATGFDWGDAGIGASLVFALVVLSGGAVLVTRHAGREQTA